MAIKIINAATLKPLVASNGYFLLDVRENVEHQANHIAGSYLLPLSEVSINKLPSLGDKKLVIYCRSGVRSLNACEKLLKDNSHLEVYNLEGGILAWSAAGGEVISKSNNTHQ